MVILITTIALYWVSHHTKEKKEERAQRKQEEKQRKKKAKLDESQCTTFPKKDSMKNSKLLLGKDKV